jgi:hypothetical protein
MATVLWEEQWIERNEEARVAWRTTSSYNKYPVNHQAQVLAFFFLKKIWAFLTAILTFCLMAVEPLSSSAE